MKENGKMIKKKDVEYIKKQMELDIKGNGKIVYPMDLDYIIFITIIGDMKVD